LTQEAGMRKLGDQIDELYPPHIYPEQNQALQLRLFNDVYQAKRRTTSQEQQKKDSVLYALVGDADGTVEGAFNFPNIALEPDALEIRMEQVGEAQERYRSFTTQVINSQLSNNYINYVKNPEDEETSNNFWNSVGLAAKANERFGMRTRVHPLFYNKAVLDDPQQLGLLYDAYERGVLGAFVPDNSDIYKVVVESFVPNWQSRPEDVTARSVSRSNENIERLKQEELFEKALDVNFDRIPILPVSSDKEVDYITQGEFLTRMGIENKSDIKGDRLKNPELNRIVVDAYLQEYSRSYAETRNQAEAMTAAEQFVKDTFVIDDIGNVDQGFFDANDDIFVLTDRRRKDNISEKIRAMRETDGVDVDSMWTSWRTNLQSLGDIDANRQALLDDISDRRFDNQMRDVPIYVEEELRRLKVYFGTDPIAANNYQIRIPRVIEYAHEDHFTEDEGSWLVEVKDRMEEMNLGISPGYQEYMMISRIFADADAKTPPSQRKDDRAPMNQKQWFNWLTNQGDPMFDTFNPNQQEVRVQALKDQPITIYGYGKQTRSFCYVSDLIDGLYKMMNSKNFTGPVNLGNPNEITILELAKKIIELTNSKSKIIFKKWISEELP